MQLIHKFSALILLALVALCQAVRIDLQDTTWKEFDRVYLEGDRSVIMEQSQGALAVFVSPNRLAIDIVANDVQRKGKPMTRGYVGDGKYRGWPAVVFDIQTMRTLAEGYKWSMGMKEPSNTISNMASKMGNYINEITTNPNERYNSYQSNSRSNNGRDSYQSNSQQSNYGSGPGVLGRLVNTFRGKQY